MLPMVLHELATNSTKYGALSAPSGRVSLEWSISSSGDVHLRWSEAQGPTVAYPETRRFGTQLIEMIIQSDLGGELSFDWRSTGLICEFSISHEHIVQGVGDNLGERVA
jgi:two-component sensor histidine kinase